MKKCIILIAAGGICSILIWWILLYCVQNNKEEIKSTTNKGRRTQQHEFLTYEYWTDFEQSWSEIEKEWTIPYADKDIFSFVAAAYAKVDFGGEFETGDEEVDIYKKIYWEVIQNRKTILDKDTNKRELLSDIAGLGDYIKQYNISELEYYFFDVDGDKLPELGISGMGMGIYFIDYCPCTEEFALWYPMRSGWYTLIGTKKIQWHGNGHYLAFYMLGEEGEEECHTFAFDWKYDADTSLYMVMLPQYANEEKEIIVTDEMRRQGVLEQSSGQWYFRFTESQYEELMRRYWEAYDAAQASIKQITYTYEELFGSFE